MSINISVPKSDDFTPGIHLSSAVKEQFCLRKTLNLRWSKGGVLEQEHISANDGASYWLPIEREI